MALRSVVTIVLGALCHKAETQIIELDMYRAMAGDDSLKFDEQNDDLADIAGVLKYVATEVIVEHALDPNREKRKYGIDAIAGWRWKVRNPDKVLATPSTSKLVDFGPFTAFDSGKATNEDISKIIEDEGDIVGLQLVDIGRVGNTHGDARFPIEMPFYWYSISGFCPNLAWNAKGDATNPSSSCSKYKDTGKFVAGGLCPGFEKAGFEGPTGEHGCVYSYDKTTLKKVNLDEFVGITEQDCGGRKCTDWKDYRDHCSNASLKQQYDPLTGHLETTSKCVEYDIHPLCVNKCSDDCMAIPEDKRELGLPFWHGRCDSKRNMQRVEKLAAAFKIDGATTRHNLVKSDIMGKSERCFYPENPPRAAVCSPAVLSGGPYCSRQWSGVCTNCYIPGTKITSDVKEFQPPCPIDILKGEDYEASPPTCKTNLPRDLCCFYNNECTGELDPYKAPLNEDGLAAAIAKTTRDGNNSVLMDFLKRIASDGNYGDVEDVSGLSEMAYWSWQAGLLKANFSDVKEKVKSYFSKTKPTPMPPPTDTGGNFGTIIIVICVIAALLVVAGIVIWCVKKNKAARDVPGDREQSLVNGGTNA